MSARVLEPAVPHRRNVHGVGRRTWVILLSAGVAVAVGVGWLVNFEDEHQGARDLLNELDVTDSVLNALPPQGAVGLRRFVLDNWWNVASGPSEPLVFREYDYDGGPDEIRGYFEELLDEGGWTGAPTSGGSELLPTDKPRRADGGVAPHPLQTRAPTSSWPASTTSSVMTTNESERARPVDTGLTPDLAVLASISRSVGSSLRRMCW